MRYFLLLLFFFFFKSAFSQISFVSNFGTPEYKSLSMAIDIKQPSNTFFVYTDNKISPVIFHIKKDTVVLGMQLASLYIKDFNEKPYFLSYKTDLSELTLFDQSMRFIGKFDNDSYLYRTMVLDKKKVEQGIPFDYKKVLPYLKLLL